jgi:CheY-like chemotaxis protein
MAADILIIDDNPQNLKLATIMVEKGGYRVHTAVDAEQALLVLDSLEPAVILMDLQLPGMDGLTLTRQIRADPARRSIRIIAVTAYAMKGDQEKALAAGCDAYVTKPIDRNQLLTVIAELVARPPSPPPS